MMLSFTEAGNTEVSHLETRGFTLVFCIHSCILNALNLRYQRGIQIEMSYMWWEKKKNPSKKIKNAWPKEFKETEEGNAIGTKRNKCSRKSRVIGRFKCTPHALGGEPENGAPKWVRHSSSPWKHCCIISLCLIPTLAPWYWDFYLSPWNSPGLWNTGPNPSLRGMVPGNASSYYFLQNTTDAMLDSPLYC